MFHNVKKRLGKLRKKGFSVKKSATQFTKQKRSVSKKINTHIQNRPLTVFGTLLAIVFVLIAVGNFIRKPETDTAQTEKSAIPVETYLIGAAPRVNVNATVEKTGVVTIVAQSGGVVQNIYCTEGEDFYKGNTLVQLSTNYQGGNALAVQRQIAYKNYKNTEDIFLTQTDIINLQRDIANKTEDNSDELRDISNKSIDETKSLIQTNEQALDLINDLIEITETASDPTTTAEKQQLAALKQQKSGLQNGLNAAKSALRNTEYSTDKDNPPSKLADYSKDLTLKQLEIQEKSLQLNKEISLLQLRLAQINEALLAPAAPFSGRIERIHVKPGQVVNPGDPIATISGADQSVSVVAFVPENIARNISPLETSTIYIGETPLEIMPTYVSREPTSGRLFTVLYNLPDEYASVVSEKALVEVSIPVGLADTSGTIPFVPLDAIFQTQDAAFIYIVEDGKAQSREVVLGEIYGSYVEIEDGLQTQDTVILNRSVSGGDPITIIGS